MAKPARTLGSAEWRLHRQWFERSAIGEEVCLVAEWLHAGQF